MNKNQKSLGNKGFSLVELIIVIAIMAVLIGVLAPTYIRYVERSRVSADTQLLDSVYQALSTCYIDPQVTGKPATAATATALGTATATEGEFWNEVYEILGVTGASALESKLASDAVGATKTIQYKFSEQGGFVVTAGTLTVPAPGTTPSTNPNPNP